MLDDLICDLVRPTVIPPPWEAPNTCLEWAQEEHDYLLVIAGEASKRGLLYNQVGAQPIKSWVDLLFPGSLADNLARIRATGSITPHYWDLLWNMVTLEDLLLGPDLEMTLGQNDSLSEVYSVLLDIRGHLDESSDVRSMVLALGSWLNNGVCRLEDQMWMGPIKDISCNAPYERFDALLFLTTLAANNSLIPPTIFGFDGLEGVLEHPHRKELAKELYDLILATNRWSRLGCPIKVILGFNSEKGITNLGKVYNPLGFALNSRLSLI